VRSVLGLVLLVACGGACAQGDALAQAVDATVQANRAAKASQERINKLDDETRALLERYRNALWQAQQLQVYTQQLEALVGEQDKQKASLQAQLREVEVTEREILPLMLRMLDSLEKFVALDLPFLKEERSERIAALKRLMADPEARLADKFARLLEAFKIEGDYANTLGAERTQIGEGDKAQLVDILRVGRTALYYQTLDGDAVGRWDPEQKAWAPLDEGYERSVRKGLRIARELETADLLVLPMAPPVAAAKTP
jgi:hypothetical protein